MVRFVWWVMLLGLGLIPGAPAADQSTAGLPESFKEVGEAEGHAGSDKEPGAGIDVGDWDWSAVTEMDTGATVGRSQAKRRMQELARKPRVGETAEPDFNRPILPAYKIFADVPPFHVISSKKDPDMHPCLDCHEWSESDLTPRVLKKPHQNFRLQHGLHGKGKFWCFTCHHLEGEGGLRTLEGVKLSFDDAYIVCSQCHVQEARDWAFGGHGKRAGNWQGKREVFNCTACHYQHRPEIKPRKPMPGPGVRTGIPRPAHWDPSVGRSNPKSIWERYADRESRDEP